MIPDFFVTVTFYYKGSLVVSMIPVMNLYEYFSN